MALYGWNDTYSVGIRQIDEQHKQLFTLINELHEAMKSGAAKAVLGKTLDQLQLYAVKHFATEESLFALHGYPESAQHKLVHDQFTAKVKSFAADYGAGKGVITIELMEFLQHWLVSHIEGTDKKYAPYLKQKGLA